MLNDFINKISEATDVNSNRFTVQVKADVSIENYDEDVTVSPATVSFELDIDYRSWGIKDLGIRFPDKVRVSYTKEDGTDKELYLDLEEAEINWSPSSSFTVSKLDIWLNADETVKRFYVDVYYAIPTGAQ